MCNALISDPMCIENIEHCAQSTLMLSRKSRLFQVEKNKDFYLKY